MPPSTKDARGSPSLENLYKDLDLYMKELDNQAVSQIKKIQLNLVFIKLGINLDYNNAYSQQIYRTEK